MLILLAEDDPKIAKLLIHLFKKDGYQVDHAKDGAEALLYTEINQYDIVLLDWMMPERSGLEVCEILRNRHFNGGILMLTAKDTLDDKIMGLEYGADDYLIKPFEYKELLARVKALSRRSTKKLTEDKIILGSFLVDRAHKAIYFKNIDIGLSNREYQLLSLLMENNKQIVPREVIIDRVWGLDQEITQNNLDAFIKLLRKKIELVANDKIIMNVRGIGYKVEV
ncbi:MAG: DNA-binding response regulator [Clostridiales bacterium 38-18]|nr:MAG: DNA-binding response regulator [Clostridiales bacterium 38-18]